MPSAIGFSLNRLVLADIQPTENPQTSEPFVGVLLENLGSLIPFIDGINSGVYFFNAADINLVRNITISIQRYKMIQTLPWTQQERFTESLYFEKSNGPDGGLRNRTFNQPIPLDPNYPNMGFIGLELSGAPVSAFRMWFNLQGRIINSSESSTPIRFR